MTSSDIDRRGAEIMAEVRASATTLRRSLGQRFRKIERDNRARFTPENTFERYMRMGLTRLEYQMARCREWL